MPENPILALTLRSGDKPVLLAELKSAIDDFQSAILALAANISNREDAKVDFEVVGAKIGSLSLDLRPVPEASLNLPPQRLISTFANDLRDIRQQKFRSDLTGPLAERYRELIHGIAKRGMVAEISVDSVPLVIDTGFQRSFEASFKERVSLDAELVGHLDAIRAHYKPYVFLLYPKLSGQGQIECRFPQEMLDGIRPLLKQVVRVRGRASYGPVGLYPTRLEVAEIPSIAEYSKERLLARMGSFKQLRVGETVEDLLARNREAAGLAD